MLTQPEIEENLEIEEVSDKIFTVPNVITLVRFLLIPLFLWLLFGAHRPTAAVAAYVVAACTDWVDGQVARRTHQVSKLGKVFDPLVDRFLLASGVISVCILGRIPLWIVIVLVARDLIILGEGQVLLEACGKIPAVIYVGKFATAFLMFGFSFLLFGWPVVDGIELFDITALPGFGHGDTYLGIWFVYMGLICSITAFCFYQKDGIKILKAHNEKQNK